MFDKVLYSCELQFVAQNAQISLTIIAFNEEANIERCIQSVPFASEVIVVDSNSTDKTPEIARRLGAKVFVEAWRGYRDQKNRAVELASNNWILSLDADEALSPEAAAEIQKALTSGKMDEVDGYEFPRLSYNMGRWIRHGGWYPDWQLRLFNRARAKWSEGHVHERVRAEKVLRLKNPILHWPFANLKEQINTNNNYSSLGAQDLFDRGIRFSVFKMIFKAKSKFFETYILKRGFLDGFPGFVISVGAAYSVFLKFAKLRELEQASRTKTKL
jgi:glycosyltransferase involved in cell wall biosynthesis